MGAVPKAIVVPMAGCKHEPVEQVRGKMGEDDYFDVLENDWQEAFLHRVPKPYHEHVELGPHNDTDFRIICKKCHLTTGWNKADGPGMPGMGIEWSRKKWAEMTKE
jgi:hypothetical protein